MKLFSLGYPWGGHLRHNCHPKDHTRSNDHQQQDSLYSVPKMSFPHNQGSHLLLDLEENKIIIDLNLSMQTPVKQFFFFIYFFSYLFLIFIFLFFGLIIMPWEWDVRRCIFSPLRLWKEPLVWTSTIRSRLSFKASYACVLVTSLHLSVSISNRSFWAFGEKNRLRISLKQTTN